VFQITDDQALGFLMRNNQQEHKKVCILIILLAGVPGVARGDQWRNLIAFFPSITKETE